MTLYIFRHREMADKFPATLTNVAGSSRIERVLPKSGPVAQLGARFHGMEEVTGSIPVRSTNHLIMALDLAPISNGPHIFEGRFTPLFLWN